MATKLFVGNLPYSTNDDILRQTFEAVGEVVSANVIMDRETQHSKGFGFVEMATDEAAQTAIDQLNGNDLDGRKITVSEARPKEERPREFRPAA